MPKIKIEIEGYDEDRLVAEIESNDACEEGGAYYEQDASFFLDSIRLMLGALSITDTNQPNQ